MNIRDVRPTDDFYRDLDEALADAGPAVVSRADFGLYVLPDILRRFATGWDVLPMPIPGRPDYRIHLGYSVHLGAYEVVGQVARDGVVELISFGADAVGLINPSDDPPESF